MREGRRTRMEGFVRQSALIMGERAAAPSVVCVAGYARVVVALFLRVRYPELSSSKAESFRIHWSVSVNCAPHWLQAPRASTRGASVIYGVGSGISGSCPSSVSGFGSGAHSGIPKSLAIRYSVYSALDKPAACARASSTDDTRMCGRKLIAFPRSYLGVRPGPAFTMFPTLHEYVCSKRIYFRRVLAGLKSVPVSW